MILDTKTHTHGAQAYMDMKEYKNETGLKIFNPKKNFKDSKWIFFGWSSVRGAVSSYSVCYALWNM